MRLLACLALLSLAAPVFAQAGAQTVPVAEVLARRRIVVGQATVMNDGTPIFQERQVTTLDAGTVVDIYSYDPPRNAYYGKDPRGILLSAVRIPGEYLDPSPELIAHLDEVERERQAEVGRQEAERQAQARTQAAEDSTFWANAPDVRLYSAFTQTSGAGLTDLTLSVGLHKQGSTVRYVRATVVPYNRVGDPIRDRLGKGEARLEATGPFQARRSPQVFAWDDVWLDANALACVKVTRLEIVYAGGQTVTYSRNLPSILADGFRNQCTDASR